MAGRKKKSEAPATVNEVLELKKSELRTEQAAREEAMPNPLGTVIEDDMSKDVKKEEVMVEIPDEVKPKLIKRNLSNEELAQLTADMTAMLKIPKTRDAVMVLSMYNAGGFNRRYFLLDVDGAAYRKAWALYKERTGTDDAVQFLDMVFHILNTDLPRLHRAVDWAPLN